MKQATNNTENDDEIREVIIKDPNSLPSLGHIDYLFVDNSLCTGQYVIDNVLVNR